MDIVVYEMDAGSERIFRESGFSVFVTRKKGLFWNYIYVYGIKFYKDVPYVWKNKSSVSAIFHYHKPLLDGWLTKKRQ